MEKGKDILVSVQKEKRYTESPDSKMFVTRAQSYRRKSGKVGCGCLAVNVRLKCL